MNNIEGFNDFLNLMFSGNNNWIFDQLKDKNADDLDLLSKLKEEEIDNLIAKVVDKMEKENISRENMVDLIIEELHKDKDKEELYKVYKYRVIIDTINQNFTTTLYVDFSEDFDEFENFVYDKLNNEKFIGFKICDMQNKEYNKFFKCSEIVEISIERAE